MLGFILKLIACPLGILISDYLFYDVFFATLDQMIILGVALAILGQMLEVIILSKGTLWISTISDLVTFFVVVYLSQFIFIGCRVTFIGALLTSLLLTVIEYLAHLFLIRSGRTKKSEE